MDHPTELVSMHSQEALDFAQEVYPELKSVPRDSIHFKISVSVNGTRQKVRIGSRAWSKVLSNLTRYEVVEIHLENVPPRVPEKEGLSLFDSPPQYQDDSQESKEHLSAGTSDSVRLRSSSSFSRLSALFRGRSST